MIPEKISSLPGTNGWGPASISVGRTGPRSVAETLESQNPL